MTSCEQITWSSGACYISSYSIHIINREYKWCGQWIFLSGCSVLTCTYINAIHNPCLHNLFCSWMKLASCVKQSLIAETATYGTKTIHIPLFSDDTISTLPVSIWAGIVSDQFTGLYLPPIRLNVYAKQQILQVLPELLRTCDYWYINRRVPVRWSNNTLCLFCLLLPGCYISPALDWVGWNNFLASMVARPDTTYFFGLTLKLWCMRYQ
jgi:hypothetical protein